MSLAVEQQQECAGAPRRPASLQALIAATLLAAAALVIAGVSMSRSERRIATDELRIQALSVALRDAEDAAAQAPFGCLGAASLGWAPSPITARPDKVRITFDASPERAPIDAPAAGVRSFSPAAGARQVHALRGFNRESSMEGPRRPQTGAVHLEAAR